MSIEAMKLALEALERSVATCFDQYAHNEVMSRPEHFVNQAITALRQAIEQAEKQKYPDNFIDALKFDVARRDSEAQQAYEDAIAGGTGVMLGDKRIDQASIYKEPVRLRRGDILRSIETDELCTVWSTSTTGKTLVKWGANDFCEYTAEQIGELFWLEPVPDDLELAAEKSDNYAAFHAGYRFAIAQTSPPQRQPLTDEQILELWRNAQDRVSFAQTIEANFWEKNCG